MSNYVTVKVKIPIEYYIRAAKMLGIQIRASGDQVVLDSMYLRELEAYAAYLYASQYLQGLRAEGSQLLFQGVVLKPEEAVALAAIAQSHRVFASGGRIYADVGDEVVEIRFDKSGDYLVVDVESPSNSEACLRVTEQLQSAGEIIDITLKNPQLAEKVPLKIRV